MRRRFKLLSGILLLVLSMIADYTINNTYIIAEVNENVGVLEEVPNWVKGHEKKLNKSLLKPIMRLIYKYTSESSSRGNLEKPEFYLFRNRTEGILVLNERDGKPCN